jgi:hypothetical protein
MVPQMFDPEVGAVAVAARHRRGSNLPHHYHFAGLERRELR